MSAIKFRKRLTKFKITIALPKMFGSKGFITVVKIIKIQVKKYKRKAQSVPQLQDAAELRHKEKQGTDKTKQTQIEQTYEKHSLP